MIFIDTNFFLRFLLKDIKNQYLKAKEIFKKGARGEDSLITSVIVIFEVFWVLNSTYKFDRAKLSQAIGAILDMTFIQLEERSILQQALRLYRGTNLSLGDCYNIEFAKNMGVKAFKTFDVKLDKIAKVLLEKEKLTTIM